MSTELIRLAMLESKVRSFELATLKMGDLVTANLTMHNGADLRTRL